MSDPSFPTCDIALAFDGSSFACDLVIENGDFKIDNTPVTPLIMSLGCDRRAAPDDVLPTGVTPTNRPTSFVERRGWVGDCLNANGRRTGSRLWLLDREKAASDVVARARFYIAEALAWLKDDFGIIPDIDVSILWSSTKSPWLAMAVYVDGRSVTLRRRLS